MSVTRRAARSSMRLSADAVELAAPMR